MYIFINPKQAKKNEPRVTWEMAQKEIAEAKGFSTKNTELTKEEQIIQEQIIELLPIISDVNAISEELNKYKKFEVILVPSLAFENKDTDKLGQK
jgi:kinesin family member 1